MKFETILTSIRITACIAVLSLLLTIGLHVAAPQVQAKMIGVVSQATSALHGIGGHWTDTGFAPASKVNFRNFLTSNRRHSPRERHEFYAFDIYATAGIVLLTIGTYVVTCLIVEKVTSNKE
jgi:hypothetical protein